MSFLWSVAQILVKNAANSLGFGLGDSVVEIWEAWKGKTPAAQQRLAEVEEVARLSPSEATALSRQIVLELAADRPDSFREPIVSLMTRIPEAMRRSLRRPDDASGMTLRPSTVLEGPESLRALLPTNAPRFKAGDRPAGIGDRELVELLGVGGFGEVWRARNSRVPNSPPVALKFCTDQQAARTLRHEAGVLSQLMTTDAHPGIVQLRHTYLNADPPCLEYEYIEGGELTGLILDWHRSGTFSCEAVTRVVIDLADVLAFAHRLTPPVVHRDLKPANVLVRRGDDGRLQVKVTDFGIGGIAATQAMREQDRNPTWQLTALARGTCTPLYASPQQRIGMPADPRDDVYALGVVWYQMLTGNLSAERPGGSGWKKKLQERGMKAELVALLERCFEDDPDDRPKNAGELADLLAPERAPLPSRSGKGSKTKPKADRNTRALEEYYREHRTRHGSRPRAVRAFQDGRDPALARAQYRSWLRFVAAMGDLSPWQLRLLDETGDFLNVLEKTPMTRSFKMLTLQAMLNLGAFPGAVDIGTLTAEFGRVARSRKTFCAEVKANLDEPKQLQAYLERNPIAAWTGCQGTGGTAYFCYEKGIFGTTVMVAEELRGDLAEMVGELVEWRLEAYAERTRLLGD